MKLDQVKPYHLCVKNALLEDTATKAKVKLLETCVKIVSKGSSAGFQPQHFARVVRSVTSQTLPDSSSANPVEEGITHTQQIELNVLDVPLAKI